MKPGNLVKIHFHLPLKDLAGYHSALNFNYSPRDKRFTFKVSGFPLLAPTEVCHVPFEAIGVVVEVFGDQKERNHSGAFVLYNNVKMLIPWHLLEVIQ